MLVAAILGGLIAVGMPAKITESTTSALCILMQQDDCGTPGSGGRGNGTPDGEEDRNNDGVPDGDEDRNDDGKRDGEEDRNDDGTPDGEEDNAKGLPDAPEDDGNGKRDGDEDRNGDGKRDGDEDRNEDGKPDGEEDRNKNGTPDGEEDNPEGLPDAPEDKGNGTPDGEEDRNDDGKPDGDEDRNKDGKPDGEEDRNNNGTPDGEEDNPEGLPDPPDDEDDPDKEKDKDKGKGNGTPDGEEDRDKNGKPDGEEDKNKDGEPDGEEDRNDDGEPDGEEDNPDGLPEPPEGDDPADSDFEIKDEDKRADEEDLVDDSPEFDTTKEFFDPEDIKECVHASDFKTCLIDKIPEPEQDFLDWLFGAPPPSLRPEVIDAVDDATDAIEEFREDRDDHDRVPDEDDLVDAGRDENTFVDLSPEFDTVRDIFSPETIKKCMGVGIFKTCLIDNLDDAIEGGSKPPPPRHVVVEGINDADKALEKFRDNNERHPEDKDADTSCEKNSFVAGTPVDLGTGASTAIEDVRVGDRVLAADPETGEQGLRTVTHLIRGEGEKDLVDLRIGDDTVTATDGHPFWVPERDSWIDAGELRPGMWLRTSTGTWSQVDAVDAYTVRREKVYNLTVDGLHTYFAGAGSLLVHNAGPSCAAADVDWDQYVDKKGDDRKTHVGYHDVDDLTKPKHGVFSDPADSAKKGVDLTEEAWDKIQSDGLTPTPQGGRETYTVDMGREIGHAGGKAHAGSASKPGYDKIKIVVKAGTNEIITAFPL